MDDDPGQVSLLSVNEVRVIVHYFLVELHRAQGSPPVLLVVPVLASIHHLANFIRLQVVILVLTVIVFPSENLLDERHVYLKSLMTHPIALVGVDLRNDCWHLQR